MTFDKEMGNFIQDALRYLFISLDIVVYKFFAFLYRLFTFVAQIDLTKDGNVGQDIANLFNRIWVLFGVVALFYTAFAVIKLIVSPDDGKKSGGAVFVKRIIVSLVLLVSVNAIFDEARVLQNEYIFSGNSNLVSNFLGVTNVKDDDGVEKEPGIYLSTSVFFGFFSNSAVSETACSNDIASDSRFFCVDIFHENIINAYSDNDTRNAGRSWNSVRDIVNDKDDGGKYGYEYNYLISTVAGVFLCYIMINYCFAIGVRVFKLLFLQLISPLPILMGVTEKGQDTLKKWGKQCVSTYLEILIKLFIINLVIVFSQMIVDLNISFDGVDETMIGWVKIVLILSALMFAKKAMDMLKELFPSMGETGLGLKKMFGGMLGAGLIGGAVGAVGASAIGGMRTAGSNFANKIRSGAGLGTAFGSAIAGGFSGAFRAIPAGFKGKGGIGATWSASKNAMASATKKRDARAEESKYNDLYRLGEKLSNSEKGPGYSSAFAESMANVEAAKNVRDKAKDNVNAAKFAYDNDKNNVIKYNAWIEAQDKLEKTEKSLEAVKQRHDEIRKTHKHDASKEDAINYYKRTNDVYGNGSAVSTGDNSGNSNTPRGNGMTGAVGNGTRYGDNTIDNRGDSDSAARGFGFGDDGGESGE